jgi:hypothetical protein
MGLVMVARARMGRLRLERRRGVVSGEEEGDGCP